MPKQEFPFPMPNGWFCISRSDEIKPGEVKSLKFCDNQVVAFRTESGEATVLDAFCPHLGAHLGDHLGHDFPKWALPGSPWLSLTLLGSPWLSLALPGPP